MYLGSTTLQASIFQIRDLIRDAVGVITDVFHFLAYMSNSMCDYMIDRPVDQLYEGNLHVLNPMYESHGSVVDPRYIKQRTDLWHAIRGEVKVFGSTLYSVSQDTLRNVVLSSEKDKYIKVSVLRTYISAKHCGI
jgi:hypothetical protein